ncbi:hypothetical protein OH77DRAFT_1244346 [Trametes cingulata]|nr:hypothetical protein OH77DRAFT_1244346 [Trametes cingulata]
MCGGGMCSCQPRAIARLSSPYGISAAQCSEVCIIVFAQDEITVVDPAVDTPRGVIGAQDPRPDAPTVGQQTASACASAPVRVRPDPPSLPGLRSATAAAHGSCENSWATEILMTHPSCRQVASRRAVGALALLAAAASGRLWSSGRPGQGTAGRGGHV